jgi:membrane protease YdiL (CAAX protease family)
MTVEIKNALFRTIPFLLIFFGLFIGLKRKKFSTSDLYLNKPISYKIVALWIMAFCIYVFAFEFTLFHLGLLETSQWKYDLIPSIVRIIGIIILAPIAEELIFRGLVLHKLHQFKIRKYVAIILQAILFTGLHSVFDFTLASQINMLQIFLDALIFAFAMYHTKSILTPILLHMIGNLVAILEQFIL